MHNLKTFYEKNKVNQDGYAVFLDIENDAKSMIKNMHSLMKFYDKIMGETLIDCLSDMIESLRHLSQNKNNDPYYSDY